MGRQCSSELVPRHVAAQRLANFRHAEAEIFEIIVVFASCAFGMLGDPPLHALLGLPSELELDPLVKGRCAS